MTLPSKLPSLMSATALTVSLSVLNPSGPAAADPLYLWGAHQRCEGQAEEDRTLEKALYRQGNAAALLRTPQGLPLPACVGAECGQALKAACPDLRGRLLGAQVVGTLYITRTRLWLHDLATGKTAFRDDYCHQCDTKALLHHAQALLAAPAFGPPPDPRPSYCLHPTTTNQSPAPPLVLSIYGDGKHKAAILDSILEQLKLRGRLALKAPYEPKHFGRDDIEKLASLQPGAHVLVVQANRDHSVQLFLFDLASGHDLSKRLKCDDCAEKETLLARLQPEVAQLLDYCTGLSCADPTHRPGGAEPPLEACEPFPQLPCDTSALHQTPTPHNSTPHPGLDPKTARLLTALSWTGVAAAGATSLSLFALSGSGAGTYTDKRGLGIGNLLDGAGWAMAGTTLGLAGLAIPTTLFLQKAKLSSTPSAVGGAPIISCPR